jgi:hypothetical protein
MGLVLEDTSDTQLDLAAYGRREVVRDLLETGLRAGSLNDVLIRHRWTSWKGLWPRSRATAPTIRTTSIVPSLSAIPKPRSLCRHAPRRSRARRLGPILRSATAISSVLPKKAGSAGRRCQATTSAAALRPPSGDINKVTGDGLRFRRDERRTTEVAVAVHVLNRMLELGRPISVRIA